MDLFEAESNPEPHLRKLIQEILNIIVICVCKEQHCFSGNICPVDIDKYTSWSAVIKTIINTLRFNDAQRFYNLGRKSAQFPIVIILYF